MVEENMQNIAEFSLKSLFKILAKRKIAFLIAFIIISIICLTLTFLASPEYSSNARITLTDNEIFYNDALYKYFPDEANDLWIIPSITEAQRLNFIVGKLDPIGSELKSDVILDNALNALESKINKTQIIESINISVDRWMGIVTIENYARTPDLAYNINKSLFDSYINQKKIELEIAYNDLLKKLDPEIELSKKEITHVEDKVKKETLSPALNEELKAAFEKYEVLNITRQNMVGNKNIFIDRISIIESPSLIDVTNTSSYLRNILLSLMSAIAIGIITAFTVNYFKNPKD